MNQINKQKYVSVGTGHTPVTLDVLTSDQQSAHTVVKLVDKTLDEFHNTKINIAVGVASYLLNKELWIHSIATDSSNETNDLTYEIIVHANGEVIVLKDVQTVAPGSAVEYFTRIVFIP